jgi:hypothetical protein
MMNDRGAAATGIATKLGNHSFRATGITAAGARNSASMKWRGSGCDRQEDQCLDNIRRRSCLHQCCNCSGDRSGIARRRRNHDGAGFQI